MNYCAQFSNQVTVTIVFLLESVICMMGRQTEKTHPNMLFFFLHTCTLLDNASLCRGERKMVEQFKLLRSGNIEVTFIFTEQKLEKWKKKMIKWNLHPGQKELHSVLLTQHAFFYQKFVSLQLSAKRQHANTNCIKNPEWC